MSLENDAELISCGFFLLHITKAIQSILSGSTLTLNWEERQCRALQETANLFRDAAASARFFNSKGDYPRKRRGSRWDPLECLHLILEDGNPIRRFMEKRLPNKDDKEIENLLLSFSKVFAKGFPQKPTDEEREMLQVAEQFFDDLSRQNRAAMRSRHPLCSGGLRYGFAPA